MRRCAGSRRGRDGLGSVRGLERLRPAGVWWRCAFRGEAAFERLLEQQIEGTIDNGGEVAAGDGVAEQIAGEVELVFEVGGDREL